MAGGSQHVSHLNKSHSCSSKYNFLKAANVNRASLEEPVVEVAQTLTPCRFAAVPLGKEDKSAC